MAAAGFTPAAEVADLAHAVTISSLPAVGIAIVTMMILGIALVTCLVDRLQKQTALLDKLFEQGAASDRIVGHRQPGGPRQPGVHSSLWLQR